MLKIRIMYKTHETIKKKYFKIGLAERMLEYC